MKSATELLEEILNKVSVLEKELNTNNFLLKTLLARPEIKAEPAPAPKKSPVIEMGNAPAAQAITEKATANVNPGKTASPIASAKTEAPAELKESKYAVVQIVTVSNKPIWLANVTVYNSKQEKQFEGTTSLNGQWNCALSSGDYTVNVKRAAGNETKELDITESFNVSAAKVKAGKITLNPLKI